MTAHTVEFDLAIVSLAVSRNGSVFDFFYDNIKMGWVGNIGVKSDVGPCQMGMDIKFAIAGKFAATQKTKES